MGRPHKAMKIYSKLNALSNRMNKKLFSVMAFALLLVAFSVHAGEYWGSLKSNKYHYPSCQWAQRIKSHNLIVFHGPEEAIAAGYVPCKVCRPPLPTKSDISNTTIIAQRDYP